MPVFASPPSTRQTLRERPHDLRADMKRLGIFVGDGGNWGFFREIYQSLEASFSTEVFEPASYHIPVIQGRVNGWTTRRRMMSILARSDVCFFEWASELLAAASHLPKTCAIVTRLHSYEVNVWASRIDWNQVERIVFVSRNIRNRFLQRFPEHAARTRVVHNGVSLTRFTSQVRPPGRLNLGMLGWLHPVKRVYEAILAVHKLRASGSPAHLHIGGTEVEGGYFDDYAIATRSLVAKLGLGDCVTFHGRVNDVPGWLNGIDVFISNSYWEGQQVSLLEALASGCYCLAHFWDGVDEVLPARNVYATEDELIRKVTEYQQLAAVDRQALGAASRAIACERFDLEATKRGIQGVVVEAAAGKGIPLPATSLDVR